MILSGAPISSLPFGAIPDGVTFVVSTPEVGADVELNKRLAGEFGLKIEKVPGWLTAPSRRWQAAQLRGRQGVAKTSAEATESTRALKIVGVIIGATISEVRSRADLLKQILIAAPVRVITPDAPTKYAIADVETIEVEDYGPHFIQKKLPIVITLTASDPYRYDLAITEAQGGAGVPIRCPVGTAPVRPTITIKGPATNPVVTLKDYLGNVISTMTFGALSLVAGDSLVIDCSAGSIAKNGVSLMSALTAGDFLKLDALAIADRENLKWPTLEVSSGSLAVKYFIAWQ